jgi:lysophospholipase L1-like esterase
MKLFTFGDSWTEGVGANLLEESETEIPEEKTLIRHKYCWPKKLSELIECEFENNGVGAFSNNAIFNSITYKLKNGSITNKDFVIIMWSSSLRDDLPFFPNENNFTIWGNRYKDKQHLFKYIFDGIDGINMEYNRIEKNFRDYYIQNLFTDSYYDIVNQNYVLYLQFVFKQLGIKYIFCDAFDTMITKHINHTIDKSYLIDDKQYWGYKEKTFADFLINLNRKDVWEDGTHWVKNTVGKHPSSVGYKLIAEELYEHMQNNNLLENIKIKNSYLI